MVSTSNLPDLLAPEIIATAGPLILETFLKHYLGRKDDRNPQQTARVDLMYDEAFTIMKTFLAISGHHTANALQKFGMTRTPAPPWVAVHRLHVPQVSLGKAADYLVTAFGGPDMAYKIAGGVKWWQVRAGPGVEAEWICMKKDYRQYKQEEKTWAKKRVREQAEDTGFLPEMDEPRCMLYIHGGAYYWGSINTHRYVIWRFAKKIRGRCFAVNYRKAPQYPFPCALQDCLAAYIYLVNPPPGAPHHPVHPKNITIAGDSAGGGLVTALLQVLRDTPGLELPAGAVLISPWLDLTHSFPSLMANTKTDVIPPYGFIHKPSSLWPPPPPSLTEEMQSRIVNKAKETINRARHRGEHVKRRISLSHPPTPSLHKTPSQQSIHTSDPEAASRIKALLKKRNELGEEEAGKQPVSTVNPSAPFATLKSSRTSAADRAASTLAQCTDPIRINILGEPVAIDNQIQLYATNAQLRHPWVSPINGYLGGLCPLYILAGDKEVLRDEIIYAAHKAAHPDKYPVADDVRQLLPSLEGIEKEHQPTNVHLQVYDGVGHDLPLFSMTRPARATFRAIAAFCRHVTPSSSEILSPTSGANTPYARDDQVDSGIATPVGVGSSAPVLEQPVFTSSPLMTPALSRHTTDLNVRKEQANPEEAPKVQDLSRRLTELKMEEQPSASAKSQSMPENKRHSSSLTSWINRHQKLSSELPPRKDPNTASPASSGSRATPRYGRGGPEHESKALPGEAGHPEIYAGPNPFTDHMIRERVDIDGKLRPLEPENQLPALTMPAEEIGMVKERPALRFVEGQAAWDHRFKHVRARIARHRARNLERSKEVDTARIVARWQAAADRTRRRSVEKRRKGEEKRRRNEEKDKQRKESAEKSRSGSSGEEKRTTIHPGTERTDTTDSHHALRPSNVDDPNEISSDTDGEIEYTGSGDIGPTWTWQWALDDEAPPPSAIVSRRDLPEGRNLALMADTLDDSSVVSALSLWMLFVAMFTPHGHVHDRNRKAEALKEAKALHKERRMERKSGDFADNRDEALQREENTDTGTEVETQRKEKGAATHHKRFSRFGRWFQKSAST